MLRIGTFRISRTQNSVLVRDADKFNNWGCKYFGDVPAARAWARWAQSLKAGRVFHARPVLSFATQCAL
jgi:hypothetical protein